MRRFLVVGCGGSGGQTLAYMMDQLRSELAASGISQLPAGWQFVHVDVPTGEGIGPEGIGTVAQQGGRYLGIGPQGGSYSILDTSVSQSLVGAGAVEAIGTWAPRAPDRVTVPISSGAGQYRAIGRMITLSRAADLRTRLAHIWEGLYAPEVGTELASLGVPGLGDYNDQEPPVVLVVSSMAGGAGASMALDVCRLLTLIPGVTPGLMGVFVFSADVFDSLPSAATTGVRANALAMLGEIVASQAESARPHDVATLGALGQQNGSGEPIPFARVFPVGRYMGVKRTPFGDGTMGVVYRGLGRGLAALMLSGTATQQFVEHDLTNTGSPDGDRDILGWGAQWDPLPWGAFGFASLSMGRDRYAEYSSQRLARSAVDRLLRGHLQAGNKESSNEQRDALLNSQWKAVAAELGLPAVDIPADRVPRELIEWLTNSVFPRRMVLGEAQAIVDRELRQSLPAADGNTVPEWLGALRQRAASRRGAVSAAATEAAYRWTYQWHQRFVDQFHQTISTAIATFGLPYAQALIARTKSHLESLLTPIGEMSNLGPADATAIPGEVERMTSTIKGAIRDGNTLMGRLLNGFAGQVQDLAYGQGATVVSQILTAFCSDLVLSLQSVLADSQRVLEAAERAGVVDAGLARVATDRVPSWPSEGDERVDPRFDNATNEVLLTTSKHFQEQYALDIQQAVYGSGRSPGLRTAISSAVASVISGIWETTGGNLAPGHLLDQTEPWQSKVFNYEPNTGKALSPSPARYDLHVRPAELVGRSRLYVARPGESFDRFCSQALRDFVRGNDAQESEVAGRRAAIVSRFREALTLALPLIGVNDDAVQAVHNSQVKYRYKFSDVPFDQLPVAGELRTVLDRDPVIDSTTLSNFSSALSTTPGTRIDIFGSYQNYSPIVFDSVLKPVAEQWAATPAQGRESFWRWRRSRPLTAALPMSDVERRTMVAGWFLGQIVGRIRIPDAPFATPVSIWDPEESVWVPFPHPLLTPPANFTATYDWLPAILESSLLAIARSYQSPVMSSMKPYQLLRRIYDANPQGPAGPIMPLAARPTTVSWLIEGRTGTGAPSRVPGSMAATNPAERAKIANEWLQQIHDLAGTHFLPTGQNDAVGGGTFSNITSRKLAAKTPIFRDLADDVYWATAELMKVVKLSVADAENAAWPKDPAPVPSETTDIGSQDIIIPEGGTF